MRRVSVIGIGAGDPDDITVAAIKALNASDVFFVIEKPGERGELADARREIIARHVTGGAHRTSPSRTPSATARRRATPRRSRTGAGGGRTSGRRSSATS